MHIHFPSRSRHLSHKETGGSCITGHWIIFFTSIKARAKPSPVSKELMSTWYWCPNNLEVMCPIAKAVHCGIISCLWRESLCSHSQTPTLHWISKISDQDHGRCFFPPKVLAFGNPMGKSGGYLVSSVVTQGQLSTSALQSLSWECWGLSLWYYIPTVLP